MEEFILFNDTIPQEISFIESYEMEALWDPIILCPECWQIVILGCRYHRSSCWYYCNRNGTYPNQQPVDLPIGEGFTLLFTFATIYLLTKLKKLW